MKIICAMNQKGGSGKTTLLLQLLIIAWLRGLVVTLIDLDPQRSAEKWSALREARTNDEEPVVVHAVADELSELLDEARARNVDLVLIDTPAAIDKTMIYAAAAADLIVVPTRTAQVDVDALDDTLTTLRKIHALAKAVVVINAPRAKEKKDKKDKDEASVREIVEKRFAVPIASVVIADMPEVSRSLDVGKGISEKSPRSAAAKDMMALFDWIDRRCSNLVGNGARVLS